MNAHTTPRAAIALTEVNRPGVNSRITFTEWRLRTAIAELEAYVSEEDPEQRLSPAIEALTKGLHALNAAMDSGAPLAPAALELEPLESRIKGFSPPDAAESAKVECMIFETISLVQDRLGTAKNLARAGWKVAATISKEPGAELAAVFTAVTDYVSETLGEVDALELELFTRHQTGRDEAAAPAERIDR